MACLFIEGFDKYGVPNADGGASNAPPGVANLLAQGDWTSCSTGTNSGIVAGLSASGGAFRIAGSVVLSKTLAANYPRLIGGIRFSSSLTNVGGVQFMDTSTAQCGISINAGTGTISIKNGNSSSGTVIATSTVSVSADSVHFLEWDLTFSNTGAYQVWLDGISILSGTGDLTATANNYANVFQINSGQNISWDDLYIFDTAGTRNNAVLLTAPRVETTFPVSDNAVQFTFGAGTVGASLPRNAASLNLNANNWYVRPITPTQNCSLVSLSLLGFTANGSVQVRPVVYSDNAGVPGSLLTSGPTVVGVPANTVVLLNLTTGQSLTAGTQYWIGVMTDITFTAGIAGGDALGQGRSATSTFASGAPSTAPASGLTTTLCIWGNVTGITGNTYIVAGGSLAAAVAGPPLPNQMFVASSIAAQEDLYNFGALTTTPTNIYAVAVKAYAAKSDSGARTVSMRTKSGATDSAGSLAGQGVGTSYGWLSSYFELDPNGNIAWTAAGLNAAASGLRIDS